jgi:inorganic phosphate transporter, PiT family
VLLYLQVDVQEWILVIGGIGIVCGLALFSSNISRCLGVQVAKITFARGFSAEFGTAITVAIASRYGAYAATAIALISHSPCICAFVTYALCLTSDRLTG